MNLGASSIDNIYLGDDPVNKVMLGTEQVYPGELVLVGYKSYSRSGTTGDVTINLTDLTGGTSSAPQEGDIVVVSQGIAGGNPKTFNQPAGWTLISRLVGLDTEDSHLTAYYKIMGSTPDTSFTISGGTRHSEDSLTVLIYVFSGAHTTFPISSVTEVTRSNTMEITPEPITPVVIGSVILVCGVGAFNQSWMSTPGSYSATDAVTFIADKYSKLGSHDITSGMGLYNDWSSGEYTPSNWRYVGITNSKCSTASCTIVLRPA